MGILIDIIVIAIIALSVFLGYKKGLIALAIKLIAVIIAIIATLILYKPISAFIINNTSIDETIQNTILEKAQVETNTDTEQKSKLTAENLVEQAIPQMTQEVAKELAIGIINIIVMLILYFAIKIGLHFVTAIANIVAKIPIIKQCNKIGGILYGLLRGLLLIYVILLFISFAGQINKENKIHQEINQSLLTKEMYQNNILNILI